VIALLAALAVQFGLSPWRLSPHHAVVLKVAGIGLVIAGFVLGRTRAR
jgi:hypothetical protein